MFLFACVLNQPGGSESALEKLNECRRIAGERRSSKFVYDSSLSQKRRPLHLQSPYTLHSKDI